MHNSIVDKIYNFTINIFIRICPKEGRLKLEHQKQMWKARWNLTLDYSDAPWVGGAHGPRAACTLCALNANWDSAKKVNTYSSVNMLQEPMQWLGKLQLHPYINTRIGQIYLLFSNWKTMLYISSSKHEVTFLEGKHFERELKNLHLNLKQLFSKPLMLSSQAHCDHTWKQAAYTL